MDLYAENIMDHYKNPRFKGILDKSDVSVHQKEANHSCGSPHYQQPIRQGQFCPSRGLNLRNRRPDDSSHSVAS